MVDMLVISCGLAIRNAVFILIFLVLRAIFKRKDPNYQPGITFIVSIRNHRQKLFAADAQDYAGQGNTMI
jgi:hypothetical protein